MIQSFPHCFLLCVKTYARATIAHSRVEQMCISQLEVQVGVSNFSLTTSINSALLQLCASRARTAGWSNRAACVSYNSSGIIGQIQNGSCHVQNCIWWRPVLSPCRRPSLPRAARASVWVAHRECRSLLHGHFLRKIGLWARAVCALQAELLKCPGQNFIHI